MKEIDDGTVPMIPGDEFIRALEETARELSRPKS